MLAPEDRWEISDLLTRYSVAADTRNFALLDDVLADDVECIFESGTRTGRENVGRFMGGILGSLNATQHNLTSSVVTSADYGAAGTTYLVAHHVRVGAEGGETYTIGGTYYDQFRRESGGWRIFRRELAINWRTGNPAVMIRPDS